MANSILQPAALQQIEQRLAALQETSARLWGTMTIAEMCWHCRQQLEFVLQPTGTKVLNTMFRYQPFTWLAIYAVPWPKESPTAPSLDVKKAKPEVGTLPEEKAKLTDALQAVLQKGHIEATHPLFGKLGRKDWGRLIWKHLDHHLRQFSC